MKFFLIKQQNTYGTVVNYKSMLNKAIEVYRRKFKNPLFIMCSDDKKFMKENFGDDDDVVIISECKFYLCLVH